MNLRLLRNIARAFIHRIGEYVRRSNDGGMPAVAAFGNNLAVVVPGEDRSLQALQSRVKVVHVRHACMGCAIAAG